MKTVLIFSLASFLLGVYSTVSLAVPHGGMAVMHQGKECFTMTPLGEFDEDKCLAVKTRIQFLNCATKASKDAPIEAMARYECRLLPKQLKYWYKGAMLIGNLEKSEKGYSVVSTHALIYKPGRSYVGGLNGK